VAGTVLLMLVVPLGSIVARVPMAALVAVMIMVSVNTFQWSSVRTLLTHPRSSSVVMLATVVVVVLTHDLAKGVLAGVLLSGIFFAGKVRRLFAVTSTASPDGQSRRYVVVGQVFFASAEDFIAAFDLKEPLRRVEIDVSAAHFWDISGIGALDRVVLAFRSRGATVDVVGLNEASATLVEQLGRHDKPGAALSAGH
jgi:SulP family sulfate permease